MLYQIAPLIHCSKWSDFFTFCVNVVRKADIVLYRVRPWWKRRVSIRLLASTTIWYTKIDCHLKILWRIPMLILYIVHGATVWNVVNAVIGVVSVAYTRIKITTNFHDIRVMMRVYMSKKGNKKVLASRHRGEFSGGKYNEYITKVKSFSLLWNCTPKIPSKDLSMIVYYVVHCVLQSHFFTRSPTLSERFGAYMWILERLKNPIHL